MGSIPSQLKKQCIEKKIVPITGEVNFESYSGVADIVSELIMSGSPDIAVLISSGGGNILNGLDIYDIISTYPGKTTGIVMRRAASMAAVILQACDRRICARHADVLIHHISRNDISLDIFDDPSGEKIKEIHGQMIRRQKYIYDILTNRTKKPLEVIKVTCAKDIPMMADEAKELGLIDEILTRDDMAKWFAPKIPEKPIKSE